jgi:hypothetical protein
LYAIASTKRSTPSGARVCLLRWRARETRNDNEPSIIQCQ